jgi:hypothetical protein
MPILLELSFLHCKIWNITILFKLQSWFTLLSVSTPNFYKTLQNLG